MLNGYERLRTGASCDVMSTQKPWLCALLLDKLGRQLAAAARMAQKNVERTAGKRAFCDLFAATDKLLIDRYQGCGQRTPDGSH